MEKKGRVILFSPVGGTDPMPENYVEVPNADSEERLTRRDFTSDGSMLHIARMYRADHIILYLTQTMCEKEDADHRFTKCIEKLAEFQQRDISCETIRRETLKEVHDFNFFYEEFGKILKKIIEEKEKEDVLLLNISSGTPAMKSALLILHNLWDTECVPIQVATPVRGMNEHAHRDVYDPEEWWDLNLDNCENPINRCSEPELINFMKLKKKEWIKRMVERYDYEAALDIAETIPGEPSEYISLLMLARDRLLLNFHGVDNAYRKLSEEKRESCYIPYKEASVRKYFEYVLSLDIKYGTGHYGDFIRAISPIISDIFIMMIRQHLRVDVYRDLSTSDKQGKYVWNPTRLQEKGNPNVEKISALLYGLRNFNDTSFPTSYQLFNIIEGLLTEDREVLETATLLRRTEEKLRNTAAHQIVSVTRESIQKNTGYSGEEILNALKKGLQQCGLKIRREDYNSYDRMNQKIIECMESAL